MGRVQMGHDSDPVYLDFFGMTRSPFARLSAPSDIFYSDQCYLLHSHLTRSSEQSDTLLVICGAEGSGKTTLLNQYIAGIDEDRCYAAFDEHCHDGTQFYCSFLRQLGFGEITGTMRELQRITREFIINRGLAGEVVLLFLDNANLVRPEVLEQLQWIAETRVNDRRVLSVVVAGNLNLRRIMDSPAMSSVKFERHINFTIRIYTEIETEDYVRHRMRLAGAANAVQFAEGARALIYRFSGGVPRQINRLCDAVLGEAKAQGSRLIDEQLIRSVADTNNILPHVVPLKSLGRRRTDSDNGQNETDGEGEERITAREVESNSAIKNSAQGALSADGDTSTLLAQVALLTKQLDHSRIQLSQTLETNRKNETDVENLRLRLAAKITEVERFAGTAEKGALEIEQFNKLLSDNRATLDEHEAASRALNDEITDLRDRLKVSEAESTRLASAIEGNEEQIGMLTALLADSEKNLQDSEALVDQLAADLDEYKDAGTDEIVIELRKKLDAQVKESEELAATIADKAGEIDKLGEALDESNNALERREQTTAELASDIEKLQEQLVAKDNESDELTQFIQSHEAEIAELTQALANSAEAQREQESALQARAVDLEELQKQLAAKDDESADLLAAIERLEAETEHLNEALTRSAEALLKHENAPEIDYDEVNRLQEDLASRNAQAEELAGAVVQYADEIEKLNQALADGSQALLESEKVAEKLATELESLQQANFEEVITDLRRQLSAQQSESEKLAATTEEHSAEIGRLTESLADRENALQESEAASQALTADITTLQRQLAAKDEITDKLNASAKANDEKIAQLNQALSESKEALQASEKTAENLGSDIENLQKQLAKEGQQSDKLEATVKANDEKIAQLNQALSESKEALQISKKAAVNLNADIESLQKIIAKKDKHSDKLASTIKANGDQIAQLNQALSESKEALRTSEKAAVDLGADIASLQKKLAKKDKESDKLATTVKARDEKITQLNQALSESKVALQTGEKATKDLGADIENLQKEIAEKDEQSDKLAAQILQNDEKIAQLNQTVADGRETLRASEKAAKTFAIGLFKFQHKLKAKDAETEQLAAQLKKYNDEVDQLTKALADSTKALREKEKAAETYDVELEIVRAEVSAKNKELQSLSSQVERDEIEINRLTRELGETSSALREKEEAARVYADELVALQGQLTSKKATVVELEANISQYGLETEELNKALSESATALQEKQEVSETMAAELDEQRAELAARADEVEMLAATIQRNDEQIAQLASELAESRMALSDQEQDAAVQAEGFAATAASNAEEIDRLNEALSSEAKALQETDERSKQLAADLDEQRLSEKRASTELAKIQKRFEAQDKENTELQIRIDQLRLELDDSGELSAERDSLEKSLEEARQECATLKAEINSLQDLEESLRNLEESVADKDDRISELETGLAEAVSEAAERESLEQSLEEARQECATLKAEIKSLNDLEESLQGLEQSVANKDYQILGLETDLAAAASQQAERESLEQALEEARQECATLKAETATLGEFEGSLKTLKRSVAEKDNRIAELEAELDAASSQDAELESLQRSLNEAQQARAALEAELDDVKKQASATVHSDTRGAESGGEEYETDPGDTTSTLQILSEEPDSPRAKGDATVLPMRKKSHGFAALDVYRNGKIFQVWDMNKGPSRVMIGRAEDCELRLVSKYISRHHAMLFASGEHVYIEDLNSFNGTFVNTGKVTRYKIKPDDNIVIGEYNLVPRLD